MVQMHTYETLSKEFKFEYAEDWMFHIHSWENQQGNKLLKGIWEAVLLDLKQQKNRKVHYKQNTLRIK